jgi:hypothetical protein
MAPWANRSVAEMISQDCTLNENATWAAQLVRARNDIPARPLPCNQEIDRAYSPAKPAGATCGA